MQLVAAGLMLRVWRLCEGQLGLDGVPPPHGGHHPPDQAPATVGVHHNPQLQHQSQTSIVSSGPITDEYYDDHWTNQRWVL